MPSLVEDVDTIEIDSSPDLPAHTRARRPNRLGKGKKRALPMPTADVIELSDSEGEVAMVGVVRQQRPRTPAAANGPVAGPSRVAALPLFLPEPEEFGMDVDERTLGNQNSTQSQIAPPSAVLLADAPVAPLNVEQNVMLADAPVDDCAVRMDLYVAQVLEIVPDVLPEHARALVEQLEPTVKDQTVERVLHNLFENPNYPKSDLRAKGKRKREDANEEREAKSVKVDYASVEREFQGPLYLKQAMERLCVDFPTIPINHVRGALRVHNQLYAPTYLRLREEDQSSHPPYKRKRALVRHPPKTEGRLHDELEKEIAWVMLKFETKANKPAAAGAAGANGSATTSASAIEAELEDGGIECACCFSDYPFDKMIQCPDAHLFCTDCMTSYAETLLGSHDANIICMDQSGCKLPFPESELRRFLTPKLLSLYERVKQRKEIEAAGLEGLEECPHCEYKVVIENAQEKLFRCQNEDCMAITCRQCKKPDHLPKSCKEVEADKKLDARHTIEEAMTAALTRSCPSCKKAFIKEQGCNKMVCPNCHTISCYVCRQVIRGYDHFNNPPPYNGRRDPKKCELWDSVEKRHSEEVTAAAKKAMEEYKRAHPEISEEDLKVELPPQPVAGPSNVPGYPGVIPRAAPHPPPLLYMPANFGHAFLDVVRPAAAALPPPPALPPPHDVLMRDMEDARLALRRARMGLEQTHDDRLRAVAQRRQAARAAGAGLPPPLPGYLGGRPAAGIPPPLPVGVLYGAQGGAAPFVPPRPPPVVAARAGGGRRARARR